MARIKPNDNMITAVEALQILCFWKPGFKTKPNTRRLVPLAENGQITRHKIGNRFMYVEESVKEHFEKSIS